MSAVGEQFQKNMGRPDPATECAIEFKSEFAQMSWGAYKDELGAGWFKNRFFYWFGPGLEELKQCLEAWSFLVPPKSDRVILGRNAYGAIVFVDDMDTGVNGNVWVLDPLTVGLYHDRGMLLEAFLFRYLRDGQGVGKLLDDSVYSEFVQKGRLYLDQTRCLGINLALSLGGEMALDNFAVHNIYDYYKEMGAIYAGGLKLDAKLKAEKAKAKPKPKAKPKKR